MTIIVDHETWKIRAEQAEAERDEQQSRVLELEAFAEHLYDQIEECHQYLTEQGVVQNKPLLTRITVLVAERDAWQARWEKACQQGW